MRYKILIRPYIKTLAEIEMMFIREPRHTALSIVSCARSKHVTPHWALSVAHAASGSAHNSPGGGAGPTRSRDAPQGTRLGTRGIAAIERCLDRRL